MTGELPPPMRGQCLLTIDQSDAGIPRPPQLMSRLHLSLQPPQHHPPHSQVLWPLLLIVVRCCPNVLLEPLMMIICLLARLEDRDPHHLDMRNDLQTPLSSQAQFAAWQPVNYILQG